MDLNKALAFAGLAISVIGLINEKSRVTAVFVFGVTFVFYWLITLEDGIKENKDKAKRNEERLDNLEQNLNINKQLADINSRLITTEKILESFINSKIVVKELRQKWTKH